MFFRLSAHSLRDSGVRRMCCSSWQILHLFSVSVEPGPEMSFSSQKAFVERNAKKQKALSLNHHSHAVPAVPEVAERIPRRDRRLRVAGRVPRARDQCREAGARGRELVGEAAPRVLALAARELRALPALAFVERDLD